MKKLILKKILYKINYFFQKFRFFETEKKKRLFRFFFKNKKLFINNGKIPVLKNGILRIYKNELKEEKHQCTEIINRCKILFNKKTYTSGSKSYLRNILLDENKEDIKYFLNFFLKEKFINIIKKYLETEPLLVELKLLWSPKLDNKNNSSGSQLFHLDYDDDKIVKFFFNISDVTSKSGPLQIIDSFNSKIIKNKFKINLGKHDDEIIMQNLKNSDIITLTGVSGDLTLLDTSSCFHRGSSEVETDRLVLYCNFVSKNSYRFLPIFKKFYKDDDIVSLHSPLFKFIKLVPENCKKYLINR
jgi:hypothetical protein